MTVTTVEALRNAIRNKGSVGFVPTMGYLHEGHLSLIRRAKEDNDVVVVSIFVNPTQFAPGEDFESYPRDFDRDYKLATEAGGDVIFYPEVSEVYPRGATTSVIVEGPITQKLCGKSRPTHFAGVTRVVNILFNMVKPDNAYFGQKDAQQAIIIKKMARELHMDLNIHVCPIVRETDGLAMSSRNVYLSEEERRQALSLNQALEIAKKAVRAGEMEPKTLEQIISEHIGAMPLANIDYVSIVSGYDLEDVTNIPSVAERDEDLVLAALAVRFGKTRLIDNLMLNGKED